MKFKEYQALSSSGQGWLFVQLGINKDFFKEIKLY